MNVLVLIAGVLDPKWPVAPAGNGLPPQPDDRVVLSPFDEAALEIALKIRDTEPATTLRAVVTGSDKLARAVAALSIAEVATLRLSVPWDQGAVAAELAQLCDGAEVVLIGREFGDLDDGLVPPMLAGLLDMPFFGRVQAVEKADPLRLLREAGDMAESLPLTVPMVASVTNDRRSRLRKPLMKNVMMARQAKIDTVAVEPAESGALILAGVRERSGARTATQCRMIEGSPPEQASALAALLLGARV